MKYTTQYLDEIKERALAASYNKEQGDSWARSHGCVITYNKGEGHLVAMPADKSLWGYPPDPAYEFPISRHIAACSPRMIISLVEEVKRLKALVNE